LAAWSAGYVIPPSVLLGFVIRNKEICFTAGYAIGLQIQRTDNQGSLIALTDESGNIVERYAFDPWGARRNPDQWEQKDSRTKWITNRGYTGHEHLDAFSIINMNGRVYDPATGMFMSPDPFIQSPGDWVNYNRYSYCMGNPMKYTDPSGYETIRNFGSNNGTTASQGEDWAIQRYNYLRAAYEIQTAMSDYMKCQMMEQYRMLDNSFSEAYASQMMQQDHQDMADYATYHMLNGPNPNDVAAHFGEAAMENLQEGYNLYCFTFSSGNTSYAASIGDIGQVTVGSNGGLSFSNPTAGITSPGFWGVGGSGGGSGNLAEGGGYVSTDLALIKGAADYGVAGAFKSATTFKGWNALRATQQAWRYENILGSGLSKTLTVAGHLGTVLGAASAIYSGVKVYNEIETGGLGNVKVLDATDTLFGAAGTVSSIVLAVGVSNPIGWVALGTVATGYGVVRLGMWICE